MKKIRRPRRSRFRFSSLRSRSYRFQSCEFMTRVKNRGITIHQDQQLSSTSTYTIHYQWTEHLVNEALGRVAAMLSETTGHKTRVRKLIEGEGAEDTITANIAKIEAEIALHGVNYPIPDFTMTTETAAYVLMSFMLKTIGSHDLRVKILTSKVYEKFARRYQSELFEDKTCAVEATVP